MQLAGVVVLYNPEDKVIENINSYINQLGVLYVVDNSEKKNRSVISELNKNKKISYINNHGNKGIAAALNLGAQLALKSGYEYLLTMDQDSRAKDDMLSKLIEFVENHRSEKLGIVSAYQKRSNEKTCYYLKDYEPVFTVMTSGSLLNLKAYKQNGKFLDKFFIDQVDNEYCLRLNKNGYKIIRVNQAILYHNLGTNVKVAGMTKSLHSYIRIYYIVRNSLYMWKRYEKYFPEYIAESHSNILEEVRKNLIYGKHRILQVIYIIRAVIDYKCNRFGKLNVGKKGKK